MEIRRLKPAADTIPARPAPPPRGSFGIIRPLEARDVGDVAALHGRVMSNEVRVPSGVLHGRLAHILLRHPWYSSALSSLVCEDQDGAVIGCIGVMPRPMRFEGRPITAAISHSFMVAPGNRSGLAALALAKKFLSGPQDLSLAESDGVSRKIWEAAGGEASLLYSLCWTRPLAPGRYVLSFLRKRGLAPALERGLRPASRLADALLSLTGPFKLPAAAPAGDELDARTLCRSVSDFAAERLLRPVYRETEARWLLETLASQQERGGLARVAVRDLRQQPIGWYLYSGKPGEIGAVIQIGARTGCAEAVLDHLFQHARRGGIIALSGQVDPALFHVLAKKNCLFHHDGGSSVLIHSKHPQVLQAIHRGDAYLTRLDGEWWISRFLS